MPFDSVWFAVGVLFGLAANGCAFLVLHRMSTAGYKVGIWRWYKDIDVYRAYWNLAPSKGWSRAPLLISIITFFLAVYCLSKSAGLGVR